MEVMILYIQYFKHNVHGLIHDWDIFLLFKSGLRPVIKGWVNGLVYLSNNFDQVII